MLSTETLNFILIFKKNLMIWKSIFRFVSEVAKFSDIIILAIFPNDNS